MRGGVRRWFLLIALFAALPALAAPPAPIAEWRMDDLFWTGGAGEVKDSSGNGHDATPMGGVSTAPGKVCRGGDFKGDASGRNDYLDAGSAGFDQTGELTVSAWIFARSAPAYGGRTVFSRATSRWMWKRQGNRRPWIRRVGYGWNFGAPSSRDEFVFEVSNGAGGGEARAVVPHFFANNMGKWVHVAGVFKPSSYVRLYVDGVLAAEQAHNVPAAISYIAGIPLLIGRNSKYVKGGYFDGLIDEARIYDVALNPVDIQRLMAETRSCHAACNITGGVRLFYDDFEDGDYAGWTVHRFRNTGCGWRVSGGRLTERRNACVGFLGRHPGAGNRGLRDYVLKTHIDANPGSASGRKSYNNGVGMVFGYVDDRNYYLVRWRDYGSGYSNSRTYRDFELIKVAGGHTTVLDRRSRVNLPGSFDLTVDVGQGNGIDVFVDCDSQRFRLHASESPPIETFGPYTNDNDSGVFYDDIAVYGKQLALPTPLAEWHFDETGWTGGAGEVQDSSGNGHDATPMGGVSTAPGKVCRGGDFKGDADGRGDYVDAGTSGFDQRGELTVSAWINPRPSQSGPVVSRYHGRDHAGPAAGWSLWAWAGGRILVFYVADGKSGLRSVYTYSPDYANRWIHVTAVFKPSRYLRLYVDGVLVNESNVGVPASIGYRASAPLTIGKLLVGKRDYYFDGLIDEMVLFDQALAPGQVRALMNRTHPCQARALDHFQLSHDGAGIFCAKETVLLTAVDNNGDIFEDYGGTVTLDTQTGTGSWVATTGDGVLSDAVTGDGKATYRFAPSDKGVAAFTLSYPNGPRTFNIDAYAGGVRDDDSEGDYLFSPNGFLMTAHPVSNPPPATINDPVPAQTAGSDFQVYLTAYGQTPTHPQCGVIEDYTGDKRLRIWGQYRNPTTGTVAPTVNGVAIPMGIYNREQHLLFHGGKATFTAKYKDAGRIRLRVYDVTEPDVVVGSTNDFTVKPHHLRIDNVRRAADGFDNPGAADASGPRFTAAGMDFHITLTAVDAEGDATPNFGKESPVEGVKLTQLLLAPAGGQPGTLIGTLTAQGNGVFAGNYNWSEAGIIRLDAGIVDGDYLGAGDVTGHVAPVGRFTPHRFALSGGVITNRSTSGCATPSPFTYMDEPFRIGYRLQALNLSGGVTQNYADAFAKLDTVAELNYGAVDLAAPRALSHRLNAGGSAIAWTGGVASITDTLLLRRAASVDGPYERMAVGIAPRDDDGVTLPLTGLDLDVDNDATNDHGRVAETRLRYGRIALQNAHGSELNDLTVPMQVEYFDGVGFRVHAADDCTAGLTISLSDLDAGDPLQLAETGIRRFVQPPAGGVFPLSLIAPGAGNAGVVGVTATVPDWLKFDWRGAGPANPVARATFGIYNRDTPIIYLRESR